MRNMYNKLISWPTEKFLYRATVLELVERGHRLQEAKKLMEVSGMNARINQDAEMLAHSHDHVDLADWVEKHSVRQTSGGKLIIRKKVELDTPPQKILVPA